MKTSDKFKYATDALKANRLRQAEALFRSILKHDASHSVAAFNLGIVCWRLGKLKSALRLHESLSEIFPANFDNLVALANLYAQTNQHERAISAYVQAMKLRPKDERVYYNLGISYEEFGDKSKALRFFERALKSNPTYFEAGVRKARLLEEMKRGPLAIRTFEKLLARALPSKQRLKLQYERACLLARLGRYIDALQAFALLKRKRLVEDMSSVVSDNIRDLETQRSRRNLKKAGTFRVALPHGRDENSQPERSSRFKAQSPAAVLQSHSGVPRVEVGTGNGSG